MEENLNIQTNDTELNAVKPKKQKKKKEGFRDKLSALWEDKRRFKSRLMTALLASLAFVFTFFIFGPFELYISNSSFFAFSVKYMIFPIVLAGLIIFAVVFGILLLLKGKIFTYTVSAVFSFTLAGYIQGNFINVDHGALDGSQIKWQDFKIQAILGLLFWVLMILLPLMLHYFNGKLWRKTVRIASVILIGAQTAALISIIFPLYKFTNVSDSGFLTKDGIYEVSDKKNVVVFLLDRFDNKYADRIFSEDPELEKQFGGFTFYEDFTGSYSRTCPAVTYLLTGVKCDYKIPMDEYFKKAWSEGTFLADIKNAGYDTKIYTDINYVMENSEYGKDVISNIGVPTHRADSSKILSAMYSLSAYRYLPEFMKPYFHMYTDDISFGYIYGGDGVANNIYAVDDIKLRKNLESEGLSIDKDSRGAFMFYHMQGSHDPFVMDENGNRMEGQQYTKKGQTKQTRGNINTILKYVEMLKELGVYDDTTIIITADHGRTGRVSELLATDTEGYERGGERILSLFIKPAGADRNEPMKRSHKQLCQDNLRASIISYFGLDTTNYARTIEDIGEDELMTRYFFMNGVSGARRDGNLITYEIKGDGNDFDNWSKISTEKIQYPYYDANK